jgi:hypothetical protein
MKAEEIMMSQATAVNNALYLRRRHKIVLPPSDGSAGGELLPLAYVATAMKNVEALGYGFSPALIDACRALSLPELVALYQELVADLKALKGAHRPFQPMYPNFPAQVAETSWCELYVNALLHYWTAGRLLPTTEVKERFPLLDDTELTRIDLGSVDEFERLFGQIASANTSLSEQDREDLEWFARTYGDNIGPLLPAAIPQKENLAVVASLLLRHTSGKSAVEFVAAFVRTATDVLRLAVALSGGDVSLATATKLRTFSRPERVLLLALVERQKNATEDMLRWKGRWVRLGEKLHPGEYAKRFPSAAEAFAVLRNDLPFATFNGQVEKALAEKNVTGAVARLGTRPGDFARRLDHLLRLDATPREAVLAAFAEAASRVSTPVLLQVRHHFTVRNDRSGLRVFFPKGNLAKAQGIENTLPALPSGLCGRVVTACEEALKARFATLPPLGRVYVDPALADYVVPFAMRSVSNALRTLVRGSRLPLPDCEVLRFFVWWRNGNDRTDIDLSAALFDERFGYVDVLSYYNLKGFGGVHSGDIVDAPEGASEFIDVTLQRVRDAGVRYVAMTVNSYTRQPFVELPECFAGWMARQHPGSGEVFEPKTVQDRLDITADTKVAIPLVIDVEGGKVIWCDMALRRDPRWANNVHGNLGGIALTLRSLVEMHKPSLYDLFTLHARARGQRVATPEEADTVFSVADGTPFRLEEIASQFLA